MRLQILVASLILPFVLMTSAYAQQPAPHQAGLVVVHGDGKVVSECIAFSEESISGAALLRRSAMPMQEQPLCLLGLLSPQL